MRDNASETDNNADETHSKPLSSRNPIDDQVGSARTEQKLFLPGSPDRSTDQRRSKSTMNVFKKDGKSDESTSQKAGLHLKEPLLSDVTVLGIQDAMIKKSETMKGSTDNSMRDATGRNSRMTGKGKKSVRSKTSTKQAIGPRFAANVMMIDVHTIIAL